MIEITAISLKTGKNHFNSTYILHILTKLLTKTNFYEKAILICSLHLVRCIRIGDDLVPADRGTHRKRPDRSGRPDDPRGNARQLLPRCLRRSKRRQSAQRRRISPVGRHSVLYARHSLCIQHPRRRIGQCPQLQQPEQRRNPRKSRQVHRAAPGKRYQGHHGQPRRPHRCRIRQPYRNTNRYLHG